MHESDFWHLIDSTRLAALGDPDEQADLLVEQLAERSPDDVVEFARHVESRLVGAYTWDVCAAATLLLGEVDAVDFEAFRGWLIGQGQVVYENAVDDADSLTDLLRNFDEEVDGDGSELQFAADDSYLRLTGEELPDLGLDISEETLRLSGVPLDLTDPQALADRLPRLFSSPWCSFTSGCP